MGRFDEVIYGRPIDRVKVFISSEMATGSLTSERMAAVEAAEQAGPHHAWHWERDANAGPYSSTAICLGEARTSDYLLLIVGNTLTSITRREYVAAKTEGAVCCIFVLDGVEQDDGLKSFILQERDHAIYKRFQTLAELKSGVVEALRYHAIRAIRFDVVARRQRQISAARAAENGHG